MSDLFDIPASILAEAAESNSQYHLTVPEGASRSKKNPRKAFWTEGGKVVAAKKLQTPGKKSGRMHTVYEVKLDIGAEGSGENVGNVVFSRMRFCKDAIVAGDKTNGEYIMSVRSGGVLASFLTALGIEAKDANGNLRQEVLDEVFTPQGVDSPVAGQPLYFEISQEEPEKPGERYNIDVQSFVEVS